MYNQATATAFPTACSGQVIGNLGHGNSGLTRKSLLARCTARNNILVVGVNQRKTRATLEALRANPERTAAHGVVRARKLFAWSSTADCWLVTRRAR